MAGVFDKLLRVGEGRVLRRLAGLTEQVNVLEDDFTALSDGELREETDRLRARVGDGEALDRLLPEAFAAVREAARRTLGQRPFDVQIMGGAALHLGNIAEMKTGEGKTLVAAAPAYLNALTGGGVHVVTTNDYLAGYQSNLMGRVHRHLGMTTACVLDGMGPDERRAQYAADITYGTNTQFGFDYLRDNMAQSSTELVQRGHHFAIVDEVDSILVDEARTPLIISGPAGGDASKWYAEFARIVKRLRVERDYEVDEKKRTVGVLEPGISSVEDHLGIDNLYDSVNTPYVGYLNNAVKAKELFKRDKDYVVIDGEVLIVDEHTGRILAGRRYNEGMHQAIEAKERVAIKAENQTLATITLQNYFRLYDKLSGMTGTAQTEAAEFNSTYKLGVVPIPTNRPMVRRDQADLVYKSEVKKFEAIVEDIAERHATGQPVLVGTTSVEKSEYLAQKLRERTVPHEVLNAKQHAREAAIVAMAGRKGSVTVATNMAGRGTDIMLGGNAEFLAVAEMEARGLDPTIDETEYDAAWPAALERANEAVAAGHDEVLDLGGLYVLGTERHESRRIDNQLRGRSGRQGDPGESRFYLSLGDELMRRFNGATLESLLTRLNLPEDVPIEANMVTRAIKSAQTQVEQQNFEVRKNVLKYDEVMNQQRKVIYAERRLILEGEEVQQQAKQMIEDVVTAYVDGATAEGYAEDWDLGALWDALRLLYPVGIDHHDLIDADAVGEDGELTRDELREALLADARRAYEEREAQLTEIGGEDAMRQLERSVLLTTIDRKWREHLYEMDYLKEGIGLRAMAQRDPLVEYQREGYDMFMGMLDGLKEESVGLLFNAQVQAAQPPSAQVGPSAAPANLAKFAADAAARAQAGNGDTAVATEERKEAPPALRVKGIDDDQSRPMTYTGPAEDGSAEVQRPGGSRHSAPANGSRRERREAARKQKGGARRG